MVALRHLSTTCLAFEDASAVWCTAALQMGLVFQEKALDGSSGKINLSLGFHFAAALLWEIQEVQDGIFEVAPSSSLGIAECRERVHFVCLTRLDKAGNGEDFGGIPTTIWLLMLVAIFSWLCLFLSFLAFVECAYVLFQTAKALRLTCWAQNSRKRASSPSVWREPPSSKLFCQTWILAVCGRQVLAKTLHLL